MEYNNRKVGALYEQRAGTYLESLGYQIVAYNYRCRMGEIDIIAKDGEYLVFCEVKYRHDAGMGEPAEAVNAKKQSVIAKCALYYLTTKRLGDVPCRFDVVSILGGEITHIPHAFEYR